MAVWRLQTSTGGGHIGKYCIDNNVAALGWSLLNISQNERESIKTYKQYESYAKNKYSNFGSVKRLHSDVKTGDLIWMRHNGLYYLGRVSETSEWKFNSSTEASNKDASNQLTNIEWKKFNQADESTVAGAIITSFIRGSTFQKINKDGIEAFSQIIYNNEVQKNIYDVHIELKQSSFYSLLTTEDCEDLLCLWLYSKFGYICIPSTNKLSTQLYECVLLDPKNGNHIYIQVKKGNVNINANDYKDLDGEVWFLTTEGQVINFENYDNMHIADPKELYEYAISGESNYTMSPSINTWASFLERHEQNKNIGLIKGIIFDTNKSYHSESQNDMIKSNKVSAWGNAQKYVERFNKNDYVLYYEKGHGIFAIGQIDTGKLIKTSNESYKKVKMIVAPKTKIYISAQEIKSILNRGFYFASTIKTPYLSENEVIKLKETLIKKQK